MGTGWKSKKRRMKKGWEIPPVFALWPSFLSEKVKTVNER